MKAPVWIAVLVFGCAACESGPQRARPTASAAATVEAAPVTSASADAGDAGADASDASAPKRPPPPPRVRTLEVPDETKSPLPKVAEWTDVMRRSLVVRPEYECTLQRVREWSRITCSTTNAAVTLVTGTATGVSLWAGEDRAQLLFPVRRGDRRVFEILPHPKTVMIEGNYGAMPIEQPGGGPIVLSETWLEGEDAPTLVVQ
jgi:hypothetical protein